MLIQLSHLFLPFIPLRPTLPPHPPAFSHLSSYPWVIYILWLLQFPYYSQPLPVYFVPTIYTSSSLYVFPHSPPSLPLLIILHVISISVYLFLF